jgi:eukaryotic-like serine/threonine-protein kinase
MSTSHRTPFEQCALASGLLTEDNLDEAKATVRWSGGDEPDASSPPTDRQLADRLIDMGKLNAWQAKQLLEGRSKFNLGPYWIVDSLGQGGMGQVFKAEHSVLGRTVAIKVLPRHKSTPKAVANFTHEIRSIARLDHEKLVRAMDAGHDGNVYYLVIEYVPGADLRKLVRKNGPMSMEKAAHIIFQVAEALRYAHSQGLIHRDVKPSNVLVTPEGKVKLSDLGLAGPMEADAENDPRYGKIVGTADYISPDHVMAPWEPTPAWDIYSLGCTLYYAATAKVPFPGGSIAEKTRAHCELRPLDPRRLNPNLTADFVDLMADMMAKDPKQRIQSAAAVMTRLDPWVNHASPPPLAKSDELPMPMPPRLMPLAEAPPLVPLGMKVRAIPADSHSASGGPSSHYLPSDLAGDPSDASDASSDDSQHINQHKAGRVFQTKSSPSRLAIWLIFGFLLLAACVIALVWLGGLLK